MSCLPPLHFFRLKPLSISDPLQYQLYPEILSDYSQQKVQFIDHSGKERDIEIWFTAWRDLDRFNRIMINNTCILNPQTKINAYHLQNNAQDHLQKISQTKERIDSAIQKIKIEKKRIRSLKNEIKNIKSTYEKKSLKEELKKAGKEKNSLKKICSELSTKIENSSSIFKQNLYAYDKGLKLKVIQEIEKTLGVKNSNALLVSLCNLFSQSLQLSALEAVQRKKGQFIGEEMLEGHPFKKFDHTAEAKTSYFDLTINPQKNKFCCIQELFTVEKAFDHETYHFRLDKKGNELPEKFYKIKIIIKGNLYDLAIRQVGNLKAKILFSKSCKDSQKALKSNYHYYTNIKKDDWKSLIKNLDESSSGN